MRIGAPLHHLDTHNNGTQTVYSFDYDPCSGDVASRVIASNSPAFFALADPGLPHPSA